MLKRFLALAPAALVILHGLWIGPKYDRFVLPAFDGHVYAAMAENPRVFTLAPWGYRILEPWIVHLLPAPSAAVGFFWLNLTLLATSVFAIGWWLRNLGFSSLAAALAGAVFAVSPPITVALNYQVLVDPLALLMLVLILNELTQPDTLVLMALFAATALTKETGLLPLVFVPIVLARRHGPGRGLLDSLVIGAPALALTILLRATWGTPDPPSSFSVLDLTLGRLLESGRSLAIAVTLSGMLFPALLGMVREKSLDLRILAGGMWLFTFGLILSNPYHYSVEDLPRLSVFAWPACLPVALSGLGFKRTAIAARFSDRRGLRTKAAAASLAICLALVTATDPYRRAPFSGSTDPVALVGRVRESLKTARALDAGESFTFESRSGRFAQPVEERFNLTDGRRQRWFLHRGFGPEAAFGSGVPQFRGRAELLLPILVPRTVTISFELDGPKGAKVEVWIESRSIGRVEADGSRIDLMAPSSTLVRGDNIVRLEGPREAVIRVIRWNARLAPGRR